MSDIDGYNSNVPQPTMLDTRPKTRVEAVLRHWRVEDDQLISFTMAQSLYCHENATRPRIPYGSDAYRRTGMTVAKLLKQYGTKTGAAGSRAKWKLGKVTIMTKVCDHCGHPSDTGTHMIDCPMLRAGVDPNKCMHCAVHGLDCGHLTPTDVYDIPSGLEPVGITPPATMPHLTTKSPLLLSMEAAVAITREAMLRAQREYARALEDERNQVRLERTLIWAREQVADITDPVALKALRIAISEKQGSNR